MTRSTWSLASFHQMGRRTQAGMPVLHLSQLPLASAKHHDPDARCCRLSDCDRQEDAARTHTGPLRPRVRQWDLPEPVAEQVHDCRRGGIARAVEGLHYNHAEGEEWITVADE